MVIGMKSQEKYRETPIGKIPEDWEVVRLGDIAEIKGRIGWHGLRDEDYLKDGDYYLVRGIDFENGRIAWDKCVYVAKKWYEKDSNIQLKEGDILITKDGTIGKVALIDYLPKKATLGTGIFRIRLKSSEYLPQYIYYVMKSHFFDKFVQLLKAGSTLSHLYQKDLVNFEFPLPPLEEQQKIAEILSTVDKAIDKVDEAIAKTERLKKGLMQELLTKGIGHTEFKDTEIGRIPKEWEVAKLGRICEFLDHLRVPIKEQDRAKRKGPYPYYGAQGVIDWIDDYIFDGEYILLAEDGENLRSRKLPIAFKVSGKFWVNNHAHVLKITSDTVNDDYLVYILNFIDIRPYIVGSAQPKLNQSDAKKIKVPLPPLEEQQKIAEILSTVDKKLELEKKRKEKLERIKKGLMNDLLTGKRRVKVGQS
jgi:type I restriction enzyme S subunit